MCVQEELNHAKEHWLPQLLQKVDKVSKAFSENFARIGSVGEVALHEEGENYDAYAIHIKVKFRQEGALEVCFTLYLLPVPLLSYLLTGCVSIRIFLHVLVLFWSVSLDVV